MLLSLSSMVEIRNPKLYYMPAKSKHHETIFINYGGRESFSTLATFRRELTLQVVQIPGTGVQYAVQVFALTSEHRTYTNLSIYIYINIPINPTTLVLSKTSTLEYLYS